MADVCPAAGGLQLEDLAASLLVAVFAPYVQAQPEPSQPGKAILQRCQLAQLLMVLLNGLGARIRHSSALMSLGGRSGLDCGDIALVDSPAIKSAAPHGRGP